MASTERIFEFMDLEEDEEKDPPSRIIQKRLEGRLEFRGVNFSYHEDQQVLKDISLIVNPGEMVALVGPTGSGKTSLIHLIERLYEAQEGEILVDGIDVRKWPRSELRSRIGLVMQEVFLFAGTVFDNVALGRDGIK